MTKILLPCLIALALMMPPVCAFAKEAKEETSKPAVETPAAEEESAAEAEAPAAESETELEEPVARGNKAATAKSVKTKAEKKTATGPKKDKWAYTVGGGIIISPEYKDMMELAYGEVDASTIGWVDLQLGLRYALSENFTLTPGLDILVNYFVPEEEDRFISHILLPSVGLQYAFNNNPAYYIGAEVSYPLADSGSEELDLSASGPGFGACLGYMMENDWNLEVGYNFLPVENGTEDEAEEYNLGGFVLKMNRRF